MPHGGLGEGEGRWEEWRKGEGEEATVDDVAGRGGWRGGGGFRGRGWGRVWVWGWMANCLMAGTCLVTDVAGMKCEQTIGGSVRPVRADERKT